jgi:serine/threonine-protein kinase
MPTTDWQDNWELDASDTRNRQGGQGSVRKVRRKSDGVVGALKELHPKHLGNTERRFRMQQEVNALRALNGKGTPRIYESNANQWEQKDAPLYAVMQWIEGATLEQHVKGKARSLDEALEIAEPLLKTIEECHRMDIHHRDLKPDNIILRDGKTNDPVLVDFGMAWCRPADREDRGFETASGQELGNRFLRLPEYTANRHEKSPRSDLTVWVGLLFYIVTGEPPRDLEDAHGKMPHESQSIPDQLCQDRRWPRLARFFSTGFQRLIDNRFQTTDVLRRFLSSLEPTVENDQLSKELEQMQDVMNAREIREHTRLATAIRSNTEALIRRMSDMGRQPGFEMSGSYSIDDNGHGLEPDTACTLRICRSYGSSSVTLFAAKPANWWQHTMSMECPINSNITEGLSLT